MQYRNAKQVDLDGSGSVCEKWWAGLIQKVQGHFSSQAVAVCGDFAWELVYCFNSSTVQLIQRVDWSVERCQRSKKHEFP